MSTHDRKPYQQFSTSRKGMVLILVLIVFSILSLLAFGLCHRVRLELKMARMRGDNLQAYYLALGGIRRAMVALKKDEDLEVDHFGEVWRLNTTIEEEGFFEDLSKKEQQHPYQLSYATCDEEGRLNINFSSPTGWINLPNMTEQLIYSILDWQDSDDTLSPGGAESADYLRQTDKYQAKNSPTTMIWELARVMNVNWPLLIGEDVNGNMVLDTENEDDGLSRWPMDDADGELDHGLVDYFTVYGDERVNLNTASKEVLSALPGIEPEFAREIVAFRTSMDNQFATSNDRFFKSFEDFAKIPGMSPLQLEILEQYGKFCSQHFRIVSQASVGHSGTQCQLTGTVRRDDKGIRLVLLRQD